MQPVNRFAFKEWAVVCAALAAGRQSLILRKGGLREGRAGFRVAHREFWLFPTRYHQQPDEIVAAARSLFDPALSERPPHGMVWIEHYAVVEEVHWIEDQARLAALSGLHVWSDRTIEQRFGYREPGLFALLARVFRLVERFVLPESPHFAGCTSWVDLPEELPTDNLTAVLSDVEFARQAEAVRAVLSSSPA